MAPRQPHLAVQLARREYDVYARDELAAELQAIGDGCTTLDFKNVHYIDSCCLTELIRAVKRLKADDPERTITILNIDPQVRRIFDLTQLSRYFDVR